MSESLTMEKLISAIKTEPPPEYARPIFVAPRWMADAARREFSEAVEVVEQDRIYTTPDAAE